MKRVFWIGLAMGLGVACGGSSAGGEADLSDVVDTTDDIQPEIEIVQKECLKADDCLAILGEPGQCEDLTCDPLDWTCKRVPKDEGTKCSDGDPCTKGDACDAAGACAPGPDQCECRSDDECEAQEDGDRCNGTLVCDVSAVPFTCKLDPATIVTCSTEQDTTCAQTRCVPETGACELTPVEDGTACDDGMVCTGPDTCQAGACAGTDLGCECLDDVDCIPYDDGDLCTGYLVCDKSELPYACVLAPNSVVTCDLTKDTDCQKNACEPETGNCQMGPAPAGAACDDQNWCTIEDGCSVNPATGEGICKGGAPRDCSDGNVCTNDGCDALGQKCTYVFNNAPCEDYDKCKAGDVCQFGLCVGGTTPVVCDDADACTDDSCQTTVGCVFAAHDRCDDDDVCTIDACTPGPGTCTYEPFPCDDGDPCTDDACLAPDTGCVSTPRVCDDGDLCTSDSCQPDTGECVFATTVCDDGNACTDDFCDPATGACDATPATDGTACDDGFAFTADDACQAGVCRGSSSLPPTVFRVTQVAFEAPTFQYDLGAGAEALNAYLDAFANALLGTEGYGEAVFQFSPLVFDYPFATVAFGTGECLYDQGGVATSCGILPAGLLDEVGPVLFSTDIPCQDEPPVAAPCYKGPEVTGASLALPLASVAAEVTWSTASFLMTDAMYDRVEGYIYAFVSSQTLAALPLQNEAMGIDTTALATLADQTPETYQGVEGFWFRVAFQAIEVERYAAGVGCNVAGVSCDDGNPCTDDSCDTATGACANEQVVDGTSCDDGFAVTTDDACQAGVCRGMIGQPPARFRAVELAIPAPTLTADLGSGPVAVNDLLGALATAWILAGEAQGTDVGIPIFAVDPLTPGYPFASMGLGYGFCSDEESPWLYQCDLFPELPALAAPIATWSTDVACSDDPFVPAPCFRTPELSDVVFAVADMPLVVKTGWAAATLSGDPVRALDRVVLRLFVTEAAAADITLPLDEATSIGLLGMLDPAEKVEHEGDMGWWFTLDLKADRFGMPTPAPKTFRVTRWAMLEPELIWDTGSGPVRVNELADALVTSAIETDMSGVPLIEIDPFELSYPLATATWMYGECATDEGGAITACTPYPEDVLPRTSGGIDAFVTSGACGADPDRPAPCFRFEVLQGVAFDVGPFTVPVTEGMMSGSFLGDPVDRIAPLVVDLFLAQAEVAGILIPLAADTEVALADLLVDTPPIDKDGTLGWWVRLHLDATLVPIQ